MNLRSCTAALIAVVLTACGTDSDRGTATLTGDTTIIAGHQTCAACRIELSDSVVIGHATDSLSLSTTVWVTRRADGHIFATGLYGVAGVAEYDPSGEFIQLLGKKGEGPKEFGAVPSRPNLLRGDTLVVYDLRLRRFMRIAPEGALLGAFSPTFRPWDVTTSPDGTLLVTGALPGEDPFEQGPPGHFLNGEGTVTSSVGDSLGAVGGDRWAAFKQIAMSPGGTIAIANYFGYDITLHFPDGRRHVLSRRADWFTTTPEPDDKEPRVTELWFEDDGRLWVTLNVPVSAEPTNDRDELLTQTETSDNVVEVIDTRSGELLASRRFDTPFAVTGGLGIEPVERPSGLISWIIWRPSVTIATR